MNTLDTMYNIVHALQQLECEQLPRQERLFEIYTTLLMEQTTIRFGSLVKQAATMNPFTEFYSRLLEELEQYVSSESNKKRKYLPSQILAFARLRNGLNCLQVANKQRMSERSVDLQQQLALQFTQMASCDLKSALYANMRIAISYNVSHTLFKNACINILNELII